MRKTTVSLAVLGVAAATVLSACSSDGKDSNKSDSPANTEAATSAPAETSSAAAGGTIDGKNTKVGIILPDTESSPRWVTADPEALKANCTKYKLDCNIQNAGG